MEKLRLVRGQIGGIVKKNIHAVTKKKIQALLILKQSIDYYR